METLEEDTQKRDLTENPQQEPTDPQSSGDHIQKKEEIGKGQLLILTNSQHYPNTNSQNNPNGDSQCHLPIIANSLHHPNGNTQQNHPNKHSQHYYNENYQ